MRIPVISGLAVFHVAHLAFAVELTFEIDPTRSQLVASSFVNAVEQFSMPQGDGAEVSSYSGTITVDVDDPSAPGFISFLEAEAIAADSGDWLPAPGGGDPGDPGDPAAANYGLFVDAGPAGQLFGAFRDTAFTITSDDLNIVDGMFESGQTFTTLRGFLDSNIISPLGNDTNSDDVTGDETVNASVVMGDYVVEDEFITLTLPVDLEYLGDVDFFFEGEIVATFGEPPQRLPGDANEDGMVNAQDLNAVGINWQMAGRTWSDGDFTGDGLVNAADLNVLALNWQATAAATAAVPEPDSLTALLFAVVGLLLARRGYARSG